ncbi:MAG TPA: FixH family protein [Aliidongia sp.]|nr:FixH family protein [Aliidongia sp.]
MNRNHIVAGAAAFAFGIAFSALSSFAAATDYRFELVGKPEISGQKNIVRVRLVHVADGKPVPDAVIFESKADMGPMGMASMAAPVKALPGRDGLYSFEVDPGMAGTFALHLTAKIQGEPETVRGTVTTDLVK